jgi:2-amino-4-hydroxy-6-hydroxymethyldihydropteridine diphosphokinase
MLMNDTESALDAVTIRHSPPHCGYLGLGSNLGDRLANLLQALESLSQDSRFEVQAVSSCYLSRPWGYESSNDFVNCVVCFAWKGSVEELWDVIQAVQADAVRRPLDRQAYADRSLDIDLLDLTAYDRHIHGLLVPHPRAHLRAFVLVPWAELAPEHILHGKSLTELLHELSAEDLDGLVRLSADARLPLVSTGAEQVQTNPASEGIIRL